LRILILHLTPGQAITGHDRNMVLQIPFSWPTWEGCWKINKIIQTKWKRITVLVSCNALDNIRELWLSIREFPTPALVNTSIKSRLM